MGRPGTRRARDRARRARAATRTAPRQGLASCRPLARRQDRLLSAFAPAEPAPRVQPRADASGSPELVPRSESRRVAPALAGAGSVDDAVALRTRAVHPEDASRTAPSRTAGARVGEHADAFRRSVHPW